MIIYCTIFLLLTVIAGRVYFLMAATKGKSIPDYGSDKSALIVVDVQEDTLSIPGYGNTDGLINNINSVISYASANGIDIIYIKQEYSNILDLFISKGKYKAKSKGAMLSRHLHIKSANIFGKLRADAFSEEAFEGYLIDNHINTLYIVGADASACIYKTALGGVSRGYNVTILKDCIFSMNSALLNRMLLKYKKHGINVMEANAFYQMEV